MIWTVLRDARRRGEIERVDKGKYRARAGAGRRCGRDRMWSVIRMRRRITADDLAELAGVERSYASSYLRDLARTEVVRARWQGRQRVYELAHGYTGHMQTPPGDNAERIRRFRAKKKAAMEALDKAMGALQEARAALADD
ncbi:winged helix-turn-helix domain-containing protein [Desulfacinum hydrothermale]|nr:winged helix-turn-helix domain-containing protein [Desulfacinum hydrothermale]